MKTILFLITVIILSANAHGQDKLSKKNYIIYDTEAANEISLKELVSRLSAADVIIYGESHDDSVTHYLEFEIYKGLIKEYAQVAVSMEMFDSEVQPILDEYMSGLISESYFRKDARAWSNYKDYRPLVELAKENEQPAIAANAPFRYVSVANKKGQTALEGINDCSKFALAPLPYDTAVGLEYEFLMDLMNGNGPANERKYVDVNQGQSLWNATMAFSISKYLIENPNQKIFHLNGKFHSDNRYGVVTQLLQYAPEATVRTISAFYADEFPKVDFSKYEGMADFIIVTDPAIPRSY